MATDDENSNDFDPTKIAMGIALAAVKEYQQGHSTDTARAVIRDLRNRLLQEMTPQNVLAIDTELINLLLGYYLDDGEE